MTDFWSDYRNTHWFYLVDAAQLFIGQKPNTKSLYDSPKEFEETLIKLHLTLFTLLADRLISSNEVCLGSLAEDQNCLIARISTRAISKRLGTKVDGYIRRASRPALIKVAEVLNLRPAFLFGEVTEQSLDCGEAGQELHPKRKRTLLIMLEAHLRKEGIAPKDGKFSRRNTSALLDFYRELGVDLDFKTVKSILEEIDDL